MARNAVRVPLELATLASVALGNVAVDFQGPARAAPVVGKGTGHTQPASLRGQVETVEMGVADLHRVTEGVGRGFVGWQALTGHRHVVPVKVADDLVAGADREARRPTLLDDAEELFGCGIGGS